MFIFDNNCQFMSENKCKMRWNYEASVDQVHILRGSRLNYSNYICLTDHFADKIRTVLEQFPAGHGLERRRRQLFGRGRGVQKATRPADAATLVPQDPQGDQRTRHVR